MRRSMKNRLTALLALCLCACICLALPAAASADVTLDKLLVAMPTTPIAYMPAGNISASSSTEGCYVQSLVWYDASGSQFSGTFGTQIIQSRSWSRSPRAIRSRPMRVCI
ncbi:MAG: hypothetical protein V8S72_02090 [Oscillospiraceae bacterium]